MDNSFKSVIDSANSILILLPTKPYFDQVAAGLSLYLSLLHSGKSVSVYSPAPATVEFNRLIGVDKITNELGNKNLVISFPNYNSSDIERVSYDVEEGISVLTIIPKSDAVAPKKDDVEFSYTGVSSDTVILIGGANETHFPKIADKDLANAKIYHIGTRPLSADPAKNIISFSQATPSVSEIVFILINESALTLEPDIATNLLMGIEDATDNYQSPNVLPETFEITAALIRSGGRRYAGKGLDTGGFPDGAIPRTSVTPPPTMPSGFDFNDNPVVDQTMDETDFGPTPPIFDKPGPLSQATPSAQKNIQKQVSDKNPDEKEEDSFMAEEKPDETEEIENPPSDWLQPKIYRGTSMS
ncbi:MAG TPA: hypothetical protein VI819_04535 [Patescibacteria group bacterium]|nr:hypothetical protein [Patescibacteria group bacterium]